MLSFRIPSMTQSFVVLVGLSLVLKLRASSCQPVSSSLGSIGEGTHPLPNSLDDNENDSKKPEGFHGLHDAGEGGEDRGGRKPPPISDEALVVCGVDGTVYTLDAWSGQLRGLFASGGPLVGASNGRIGVVGGAGNKNEPESSETPSTHRKHNMFERREHVDSSCGEKAEVDEDGLQELKFENLESKGTNLKPFPTPPPFIPSKRLPQEGGDSDSDDGEEDLKSSAVVRERIVPGLDGRLYALVEELSRSTIDNNVGGGDEVKRILSFDLLPISVEDATTSPVTSCRRVFHSSPTPPVQRAQNMDQTDFLDLDQNENGSVQNRAYFGNDDGHDHDYTELRDETADENSQEDMLKCELVMGQRETKIFALDPQNGSVRWVQTSSASGDNSFTANNGDRTKTGRTVLLRREDNTVRSVDSSTGQEEWHASVANFSALQAPSTPSKASGSAGGEGARKKGEVIRRNARNRQSLNSERRTLLPRLSGMTSRFRLERRAAQRYPHRTRGGAHLDLDQEWDEQEGLDDDDDDDFGEDENQKQDTRGHSFIPFPSISFGEDGSSIMAVDGATGEVLWKRRIKSVVAAVYGVGREDGWVSLDIIDEYNAVQQQIGGGVIQAKTPLPPPFGPVKMSTAAQLLPSPTSSTSSAHSTAPTPGWDFELSTLVADSSTSLIPYKNVPSVPKKAPHRFSWHQSVLPKPRQFVRLGFESSTLFAAPSHSFQQYHNPPNSKNSEKFEQNQDNPLLLLPQGEKISTGGYVDLPNISPPPIPVTTQTKTHSTEHGLFITWQMVFLLVTMLCGGALCGRMAYLRGKRKWQRAFSGPILASTDSSVSGSTSAPSITSNHSYPQQNQSSQMALIRSSGRSSDGSKYSSDYPLYRQAWQLSSSGYRKHHSSSAPVRSNSLPLLSSLIRSNSVGDKITVSKKPAQGLATGSSETPNTTKGDFNLPNREPSSPALRATSAGTTITPKTPTLPSINKPAKNPSSPVPKDTQKEPHPLGAMGSIDGIPLVRYSRYGSEFQEQSALGKGGFGTVFQCTNALDGRGYAVKKIWIKARVDGNGRVTKQFSNQLRRVLREVKILALLDHPNIVRYYTAWLELEEEGKGDHSRDSEGSTTFGNGTSHFYSSELLTGANPSVTNSEMVSSWTISQKPSKDTTSQKRKHSQERSSVLSTNNVSKSNPLGWNDFLTNTIPDGSGSEFGNQSKEGMNSLSMGTTNKPKIDDDDIGFNWVRSSCESFQSETSSTTQNQTAKKPSCASVWDKSSCNSADDESSSSDTSSSFSTSHSVASPFHKDGEESSSELDKSLWKNPLRVNGSSVNCQPIRGRHSSGPHSNGTKQSFQPIIRNQRHILYIQMQLCSQKTLADFLGDPNARKMPSGSTSNSEPSNNSVDIPHALRLFGQIARGVKHVHERGLIHRDLKPSNCFIDDVGVLKIGDFGLSRESSSSDGIGKSSSGELLERNENGDRDEGNEQDGDRRNSFGYGENITAGVGTRSYASPEQMNGSDYDSSTDVYSLGVMLFELCYPMYTGMERHMVFKGVRRRVFPPEWYSSVATSFPTLHDILVDMLSPVPSERPSSSVVADKIDSLLGEYTVLSLDTTRREAGSFLLRVEAAETDGVLNRTMNMIRNSAPHVKILQYGLRGQESKAIMEFALSFCSVIEGEEEDKSAEDSFSDVFSALNDSEEISVVRQVAEKHVDMSSDPTVSNGGSR